LVALEKTGILVVPGVEVGNKQSSFASGKLANSAAGLMIAACYDLQQPTAAKNLHML